MKKNCFRTSFRLFTFLSTAVIAQSAAIMLDFGPTAPSGDMLTNSPAHAEGLVDSALDSWNVVGTESGLSGSAGDLVYANGTAATGVAFTYGSSLAGSKIIDYTGLISNSSNLGGVTNTGIYEGTSAGKDGIFHSAGGDQRTDASLGIRVDGLDIGNYAIYVMGRNTFSTVADQMGVFIETGETADSFDFGENTPAVIENLLDTVDEWVAGINYTKVDVVVENAGDSLYIAVDGLVDSQTRGFLNAVQIVPQLPRVEAPVFNPGPEGYTGSAEVTITTETDDAEIRYTLDGSTPARDHGTIYSSPVMVAGDSVLLQAIAYVEDNELEDSVLAEALFRVEAGVYYIDPESGSMDNDGSANSPWSTLEAVFSSNKTFEPDDVIYLRSGYHGSPQVKGNNAGYVTIMAQQGHTPELRDLEFSGASNWIVSGLSISPEFADSYGRGTIVEVLGNCNNITIQNCHVFNADSIDGWTNEQMTSRLGIGFRIRGQNVQLLNNHIRHINYGVEVIVTAPGMIFRGNLIERLLGDAVRLMADNGLYEDNILRNFFGVDDHHDDGFQSWTGGTGGVPVGGGIVKNVTIRRNIIIDRTSEDVPFPPTYGLQGIGFFDGFYENCVFENNIVVTDMTHGITVMGARNCSIINNTVLENPLDVKSTVPRIEISDHKDQRPSTGNFIFNNIATTLNASSLAAEKGNNIVGRDYDEIFVDFEGFDFRLKPGSAAIDAADPDYAPEDDNGRNLRDELPDIGALEYYDITGLFPSALLISGDWYELEWMASGWINTRYFPWVMHGELGWLWMGGASSNEYWMYDPVLGWLYGSPQMNDIYYGGDNLTWLYHDPDTGRFGEDRWLYDFSAQDWVQ